MAAVQTNRKSSRRKHERRARLLRLQAKRSRRVMRAVAWRSRGWWQKWPLELLALEKEIPAEYACFERGVIGDALVYRCSVHLDTIGIERRLVIIFPGPPSRIAPIVMDSGP